MRYLSTRRNCEPASFQTAILQGLAPDGGLYLPEVIPTLPVSFIHNLRQYSLQEIGEAVTRLFIGNEISQEGISHIIRNSLTFPAPITRLSESFGILELFHGPSLAFKDFGARFMAQTMGWFVEQREEPLHILVATSGDTGGAVADGFLDVPGITVSILYPKGGVSDIQERQLTTHGANITAYQVDGTFDDCQRMVKEAFLDADLQAKMSLSSANSINIARLIPQTFYYLSALSSLYRMGIPHEEQITFSVPSGNLGNVTAGLIAKRMGAPIAQLIAATNRNDTFPRYLKSGKFEPVRSQQTISNAMDVGNPSNFERLHILCEREHGILSKEILGDTFDDETTREEMRRCFKEHGYLIDPHGAVALLAARRHSATLQSPLQSHPHITIALGTAHPIKFERIVKEACGVTPPIPSQIAEILEREKQFTSLRSSFADLKECLLSSL